MCDRLSLPSISRLRGSGAGWRMWTFTFPPEDGVPTAILPQRRVRFEYVRAVPTATFARPIRRTAL